MEILKYLDVLIGLAVVMLLLSPLVSAITQVIVWLSGMRAGRLQVGLENLLLQLNGSPYERFDEAEVTGLKPNQVVLFEQPPIPAPDGPSPVPVIGKRARLATFVHNIAVILQGPPTAPVPPGAPIRKYADGQGNLELIENVPAVLTAHRGSLRPALSPLPKEALPAAMAIRLRPRGTTKSWAATSSAVVGGACTVDYNFVGPSEFASRTSRVTIAGGTPLADGTALSAMIASGTFKGTPLLVDGHVCSYPPHIDPVPSFHSLAVTLDPPPVAPVPPNDIQIDFTFDRRLVEDGVQYGILSPDEAREIARTVLLHPMICQPKFLRTWLRKGEVVEREELIRILLEFAANPVATDGISSAKPKTLAAKQKLKLVLAGNDVADPGRALVAIRDAAQSLELNESGKSTHERLTKAILMSAQSAFVGRINNWFDQIMDRTTAEYKFRAQLWTVLGALLVALVVQLDSIALLKRLSADDKLRDSLVKQGENLQKRIDTPPPAGAAPNPAELAQAKARRDEIETNLATLRDPQLSVLPEHFILYLPTSRARLQNNPAWPHSLPRRMEFLAGDKTYPLEPNWTGDTLGDIERSVRNSNAPLKTTRETVAGHDDVVFTARNDAVPQLRWQPGNPLTNMLNTAAEQSCKGWVCFDRDLFWSSWRGVLLTWILLSLGAPFWYDALKDMLKLRSSLAKKEEDARIDRQTNTTVKTTAKETAK